MIFRESEFWHKKFLLNPVILRTLGLQEEIHDYNSVLGEDLNSEKLQGCIRW